MAKPKQSLAERLLAAQVAIDNALSSSEVKPLLAVFGYDEARLNAGKALLDSANRMQQTQQKEYGDQFEATGALKEVWEKSRQRLYAFCEGCQNCA